MTDRIINGVRLQVVADLATSKRMPFDTINLTSTEQVIADKARNYLDRMRRKGFAKEQCRLAFWRKMEQLASAIEPT